MRPTNSGSKCGRGSARSAVLGVARGVGGDEDDVDPLAVGVVEPGHRRGEVGHHRLADVGAVGVAEEDQRQVPVGVLGERVRLAVGVGQRRRGHRERRVEHGAGQLARRPRLVARRRRRRAARSGTASECGERLLRTTDPRGEVLGQRGQRAQARGPVVRVVEQGADERRADDHAVGVRRRPRRPGRRC